MNGRLLFNFVVVVVVPTFDDVSGTRSICVRPRHLTCGAKNLQCCLSVLFTFSLSSFCTFNRRIVASPLLTGADATLNVLLGERRGQHSRPRAKRRDCCHSDPGEIRLCVPRSRTLTHVRTTGLHPLAATSSVALWVSFFSRPAVKAFAGITPGAAKQRKETTKKTRQRKEGLLLNSRRVMSDRGSPVGEADVLESPMSQFEMGREIGRGQFSQASKLNVHVTVARLARRSNT